MNSSKIAIELGNVNHSVDNLAKLIGMPQPGIIDDMMVVIKKAMDIISEEIEKEKETRTMRELEETHLFVYTVCAGWKRSPYINVKKQRDMTTLLSNAIINAGVKKTNFSEEAPLYSRRNILDAVRAVVTNGMYSEYCFDYIAKAYRDNESEREFIETAYDIVDTFYYTGGRRRSILNAL